MFAWLQRIRRRRLLAAPFPPAWEVYLRENVAYYPLLTPEEQTRLRDNLRVFLSEKYWEGLEGVVLTDEIRITVAAQACLLTLNLPDPYYSNVQSILIYPTSYWAPERSVGPAGVVTEGESLRAGEAWERGPVVLSWNDARAGGRDPADGRNLVFHEFAHKLDMGNGHADGVPLLPDEDAYDRWVRVMQIEYAHLASQAALRHEEVLDHYGAKSPAEMFAVATEAFFERATEMRAMHPQLYALLRDFYLQDPAVRWDARGGPEISVSPHTIGDRKGPQV